MPSLSCKWAAEGGILRHERTIKFRTHNEHNIFETISKKKLKYHNMEFINEIFIEKKTNCVLKKSNILHEMTCFRGSVK